MPVSDRFMPIPPRHQRALELLREQRKHDGLGCIGTGALRDDDDDPFTIEQIAGPLFERGLIEDLTWTDLGEGGKYFVRITNAGLVCLGLGYMLREPRKVSEAELKRLGAADQKEQEQVAADLSFAKKSTNPHDPNEEREAIA
jgi:hypothetical protein